MQYIQMAQIAQTQHRQFSRAEHHSNQAVLLDGYAFLDKEGKVSFPLRVEVLGQAGVHPVESG